MRFLIIIPVHNEEQWISEVLQSLCFQNFTDFECVIVNDGSSDDSQLLIEKFISNNKGDTRFQLINLNRSEHQPGAKVVQTFNKGLEASDLSEFDIICKFDADIIFPVNYLSALEAVYRNHPQAGMVSGLVYIQNRKVLEKDIFFFENDEKVWHFENLSSKFHVRGPVKSYRKACFQNMKGLKSVLGWDNIDVMLARKNGWQIITLPDLWVKHLRPTAFEYKNTKAEKLGEYFYNIGLNVPLMMVSALKSSFKNKSVPEFFITVFSFLKQNGKRELSQDEIQFIRQLRWKQMFKFK